MYQSSPAPMHLWPRMDSENQETTCHDLSQLSTHTSTRSTLRSLSLVATCTMAMSPVQTMLRLLPMSISGCLCNIVVALLVGRIRVVFLIVCGTTLTATANLLFAVIDVSSPYWAFGFPATVVSVFGADFVFATGTLFVAKISLPHEQSVAGALFQTLTQLGGAFGLAITTIIFEASQSPSPPGPGGPMGSPNAHPNNTFALPGPPPPLHQLSAYHAAMWGGFDFGVAGALLAATFLRSVGIVGLAVPSKNEEVADDTQSEKIP